MNTKRPKIVIITLTPYAFYNGRWCEDFDTVFMMEDANAW